MTTLLPPLAIASMEDERRRILAKCITLVYQKVSMAVGTSARQVRICFNAIMSIMKQSTLNFSAAKRTASTGKPKVFSTPAIKPKASLPAKAPSQRKETSEDDIENYDDFVLRDTSSEEIESDSKSSSVDATEVTKGKLSSSGETLARTTRSWTKTSLSSAKKPGTEKEEAASQPFRNLNPIEPEDLERNVEITSDSLPELDPSSRKWNELHNIAKAKLGGPPSMIPLRFFGFSSIEALLISPRKGR